MPLKRASVRKKTAACVMISCAAVVRMKPCAALVKNRALRAQLQALLDLRQQAAVLVLKAPGRKEIARSD